MSKLTFKYFKKLHEKFMSDSNYREGYEYAQKLSYDNLTLGELRELVSSYIDVAMRYDNVNGYGHAQAIREILQSKVSA